MSIQKEREIAARTLKLISKLHNRYYDQFEETFASIMEELKKENIYVIKETEMTDEQKTFITSFYRNKLNGSTNPLFLSGTRPLDDQTDEDIYLAIRLLRKDETGKIREKDYAVIELPTGEFGRFIQLPDSEGKTYLMFLDDVIRYCLPMICVGMKYTDYEAYTFKFTKDAEMEIDSDMRTGVLQKISKGVKSRKKGEPIRFVYDEQIPKDLLKKLVDRLNVDKNDTRVAGGRYHNFKDLMKFPVCGHNELKYPVWEPIFKPELNGPESLLTLIRQKDRSLHYPFHSFDTFIRVLREAAINVPDGKNPTVLSDQVDVVVVGPSDQLQALTADKISGRVDFENRDTGHKEMEVTFSINDASGCWAYGQYTVSVDVADASS